MTTYFEPLPGLLDDPLLHLSDLPTHNDVHIAPLRDPFPSRTSGPSPLEPNTSNDKKLRSGVKLGSSKTDKLPAALRSISRHDTTATRHGEQTGVASIETLVTNSRSSNPTPPKLLQPSFVNLAALENKTVAPPYLIAFQPSKRIKLDTEYHGEHRQLPKPRQREPANPVPLLPAIVNGLHEPPPSADLFPAMELEKVRAAIVDGTHEIPMELEEVRAMLEIEPIMIPLDKMLNTPELTVQEPVPKTKEKLLAPRTTTPTPTSQVTPSKKGRRWRRWSEEETNQLLKGVAKHGAGKWKDICLDPEFKFMDRKPMDLKDRFRVCVPAIRKQQQADSETAEKEKQKEAAPVTRSSFIDADIILEPATLPESSQSNPVKWISDLCSQEVAEETPNETKSSSKPTPADMAIVLRSRNHQRVRRLWTEEEHASILKGFGKHGYQWTVIRNDSDLGLGHRKATDIRDKFRSLFPREYMTVEAGPSAAEKKKSSAVLKKAAKERDVGKKEVKQKKLTAIKKALTPSKSRKPEKAEAPQHPANLHLPSPGNMASKPPGGTSRLESQIHSKDTTNGEGKSEQTLPGASGPETITATASTMLTLPPLALGGNHWDWDDNKLAPLLDWEEFI